jgi:hypothetical protein
VFPPHFMVFVLFLILYWPMWRCWSFVGQAFPWAFFVLRVLLDRTFWFWPFLQTNLSDPGRRSCLCFRLKFSILRLLEEFRWWLECWVVVTAFVMIFFPEWWCGCVIAVFTGYFVLLMRILWALWLVFNFWWFVGELNLEIPCSHLYRPDFEQYWELNNIILMVICVYLSKTRSCLLSLEISWTPMHL